MLERRHLSGAELELWAIPIARCRGAIEALRQPLDADERSRAERFRHAADRELYVVSHGALRGILAAYLPADPASLRFRVAEQGKPALIPEPGWPDLRFNLSHTRGMALCAVAVGREVGVDVEWIDAASSHLPIADRFFSAHEVAALHRLPAALRLRGFFNCWTRKEAYIKARGEGLSLPLASFDVSLAPGEPAALLAVRSAEPAAEPWSLHDLTITEGYAAALAVASGGTAISLRTMEFMPPQGSRL